MSHRDGRLLMPSDRHGKVLFLLKSSDAAFIAMMRWISYNQLKERYPDVSLTYGYLTKRTRIHINWKRHIIWMPDVFPAIRCQSH